MSLYSHYRNLIEFYSLINFETSDDFKLYFFWELWTISKLHCINSGETVVADLSGEPYFKIWITNPGIPIQMLRNLAGMMQSADWLKLICSRKKEFTSANHLHKFSIIWGLPTEDVVEINITLCCPCGKF